MICKDTHSPVRCKDGWVSFLDQGVLAKDGRLEKITLLVSVPTESPRGTFQKFLYPKPGNEIRVQNESCNTIFLQSENKFIVTSSL